jgi:hypothetical protein
MAKVLAALLAVALTALPGAVHAAAPSGRQVPTETIIVPPGSDSDTGMPDIPPQGGETNPDASAPADTAPTDTAPADETPPADATTPAEQAGPLPTIEYDVSKLPAPVRRLREQIIEAASTGDIEKLKPILDANGEPPAFGYTEADDPLTYLKSQAGDPDGREILAILLEVIEAGYVHVDVGTTEEMYIWPYFARYPLDKLNGPQMVELFKILTAGDYEDMKAYGTYLFYRVGITPNGVWKYFISGD